MQIECLLQFHSPVFDIFSASSVLGDAALEPNAIVMPEESDLDL